jgi:hypothetical protein
VLRDFASTAGVHIWSRTDDTLHADAKSLVFAAHSTGPKQIILPRPAIVRNALTDALIPCLGCQLEFSAKAGDVLLFDLLPA